MTGAAFISATRGIAAAPDGHAPGRTALSAREQLEDAVRGQLRRAWRTAIAYVASDLLDDPSLLCYPEDAGAVAVVMAAADAYAGGGGTGAQDGARLLTVGEVASAARVALSTVYRAIGSGELNAARIGRAYRVRESDARRWLGGGS